MADIISVFVTTSSKKEAQKIANALVKQKLAACVQILPQMESIYIWEKKICRDKEFLVIIKSQKKLFLKLEKTILKLHSYKVPQIVALPIIKGHGPYLQWLKISLHSN